MIIRTLRGARSLGLFILLGLLLASPQLLLPSQAQAVTRVEVVQLSLTPLVEEGFEESSTLEPLEDLILYSKVQGRLEKLTVSRGERVTPGQLVAKLDHREKDARIRSAQAQLLVGNAQLAQAQAELENAAMEQTRYERLFKEGYATQQQLDSKKTIYRTNKAQVDLARAQVRQLQAELEAQKVDLSEYTLEAPIPGVVLEDYSNVPGNMISQSTPVIRLANTDTLKATIQAPELRAARIVKGMPARISVTAYGDRTFEGTVQFISPFVDTQTRTTTVEVCINNTATGYALKPGMFARVFLVEHRRENALMIPQAALREENGVFQVAVARENNAELRKVVPGIRKGELVEITEGLAPEDLLIIRGGSRLKEGDPINYDDPI